MLHTARNLDPLLKLESLIRDFKSVDSGALFCPEVSSAGKLVSRNQAISNRRIRRFLVLFSGSFSELCMAFRTDAALFIICVEALSFSFTQLTPTDQPKHDPYIFFHEGCWSLLHLHISSAKRTSVQATCSV